MRQMQQDIIKNLGVLPNINPSEQINLRSQFLADYLIKAKLLGFVLGISGGQDSLLAGILAQNATKLCRNSGYNATFHAILLPYGKQADRQDAELAINIINPDVLHDLNIKHSVDAFCDSYTQAIHSDISDFNKGNVKARVRMIAQYAIAGEHNLLVVGSDHASEAITGFFTKFGDGGADITPLSGLTKRQGRSMLEYLNVPQELINKTPTADLLDNKPAQSDETELGITYQSIDDYLEGKYVTSEIADRIEAKYINTKHKRTLPIEFSYAESSR